MLLQRPAGPASRAFHARTDRIEWRTTTRSIARRAAVFDMPVPAFTNEAGRGTSRLRWTKGVDDSAAPYHSRRPRPLEAAHRFADAHTFRVPSPMDMRGTAIRIRTSIAHDADELKRIMAVVDEK